MPPRPLRGPVLTVNLTGSRPGDGVTGLTEAGSPVPWAGERGLHQHSPQLLDPGYRVTPSTTMDRILDLSQTLLHRYFVPTVRQNCDNPQVGLFFLFFFPSSSLCVCVWMVGNLFSVIWRFHLRVLRQDLLLSPKARTFSCPDSEPPALGLKIYPVTPRFYVGSGPHACMGRTSPMETSPGSQSTCSC